MLSALLRSSVLPAAPEARQGFCHPAVGEVFQPHHIHRDNEARRTRGIAPIYLPAIVGAQREIDGRRITDGPKRSYDYLIGRAGENGDCFPSYDRVARDLGKSPRQVQNDIQVLEELGLIAHEYRAGRKSNTYRFIWHSIFERQWIATQMSGKIRTISSFEWQNPTDLSGSGLPTNLYKESSQKKAAAAERARYSTDSVQVVSEKVAAPSSDRFPGEKSDEVARARAIEEVSAALSRNSVAIRAISGVPALIAFARENGAEPAELARFIDHKSREKSAVGDPIRSVKFFFRCIPGDLPAFRDAVARQQVEHSPPRFWNDPYGSLTPKGKSNG